MTSSDLESLSEIFNDTKHRAVSLRQLSFLSANIFVPQMSHDPAAAAAVYGDVQYSAAVMTTSAPQQRDNGDVGAANHGGKWRAVGPAPEDGPSTLTHAVHPYSRGPRTADTIWQNTRTWPAPVHSRFRLAVNLRRPPWFNQHHIRSITVIKSTLITYWHVDCKWNENKTTCTATEAYRLQHG